jgi:hypothetical protein
MYAAADSKQLMESHGMAAGGKKSGAEWASWWEFSCQQKP